ncbi:hypothetical protein [Microbacterium pumilum]|uniref:Uncharacterized protein n=1 Tax=Microbacterium pumilum TaxID=344165 RepID=A0ABP5DSY0_9MICO
MTAAPPNMLEQGLLVSRCAVARNLAAAVTAEEPPAAATPAELPALTEPDRRSPRLRASARARAADKRARTADSQARTADAATQAALGAARDSRKIARDRVTSALQVIVGSVEAGCADLQDVIGRAGALQQLVQTPTGDVLTQMTALGAARAAALGALDLAASSIEVVDDIRLSALEVADVAPLANRVDGINTARAAVIAAARGLTNALVAAARDHDAGRAYAQASAMESGRSSAIARSQKIRDDTPRLFAAMATWRAVSRRTRRVISRAKTTKDVSRRISVLATRALASAEKSLSAATLAVAEKWAGKATAAASGAEELGSLIAAAAAEARGHAGSARKLVRRADALHSIDRVLPRAGRILDGGGLELRLECVFEINRAALFAAAAELDRGGSAARSDASDQAHARAKARIGRPDAWLLIRADPELSYSLACYLTRWRRYSFDAPEVVELFEAAMADDAICDFIARDPELRSADDQEGFAALSRRATKEWAERRAARNSPPNTAGAAKEKAAADGATST